MNWDDSAEQSAFRLKVRSFIRRHLPPYYQRLAARGGELSREGGWQHDRLLGSEQAKAAALSWEEELGSEGWIAPHWPREYGGAGLTVMEQFIFNQELSSAGAPEVGGQGVTMLGPTVIVHGTPAQRNRFLTATLNGEMTWAQAYSEPGAGSDLASLQTRAVRDGDDWVINGQKIWTSNGHRANWLFALVRTDPDAPKHRGISFMLMRMDEPGLTIRPLMSAGGQHFANEVFFDDVRVPGTQTIGDVNRGWYVGMTLLDFERSWIGGAIENRRDLMLAVEHLKTAEGDERSRVKLLPILRSEIAERYIETEISFNLSFRVASIQASGQVPNYEASASKAFGTELSQRIQRVGMKLFGLYSNIWERSSKYAPLTARYTQNYVHMIPNTISGGTSEIQRNVIATRGLGLPRG